VGVAVRRAYVLDDVEPLPKDVLYVETKHDGAGPIITVVGEFDMPAPRCSRHMSVKRLRLAQYPSRSKLAGSRRFVWPDGAGPRP
jgi:hypothetical protein